MFIGMTPKFIQQASLGAASDRFYRACARGAFPLPRGEPAARAALVLFSLGRVRGNCRFPSRFPLPGIQGSRFNGSKFKVPPFLSSVLSVASCEMFGSVFFASLHHRAFALNLSRSSMFKAQGSRFKVQRFKVQRFKVRSFRSSVPSVASCKKLPTWNLNLGACLEFGVWSLEFSP